MLKLKEKTEKGPQLFRSQLEQNVLFLLELIENVLDDRNSYARAGSLQWND